MVTHLYIPFLTAKRTRAGGDGEERERKGGTDRGMKRGYEKRGSERGREGER